MPNTHQKLEEAVRKACPDLMGGHCATCGAIWGECTCAEAGRNAEWVEGYPIQLQHVLRTIGYGWSLKPLVSKNDYVYIRYPDWKNDIEWNLTQPLSGQSEKTKSWLEEVICEQ